MGEMNWYLGMRYDRNASTGTITLNQSKYAQDILDRFSRCYKDTAYKNTPMMVSLTLSRWSEEEDSKLSPDNISLVNKFPYRQVVGSLLYLSVWTRPDIQYAIISLAK